MARAQISLDTGSDTDLTLRAAEGDTAAFEELYRRHSEAAYRVARAVTRNTDDAADAVSEAFTKVFSALPRSGQAMTGAFRPYVLASTRNAAIDILRRRGKALPTAPETMDRADSGKGPDASLLAGADSAMVMAAMEGLPERWRTILWLTEVEGMAPRDAAPVMGLTANGASQLAVRARTGLREAYLQQHLSDRVDPGCKEAVPLLGAYVAGGLSARDTSKVDQHLAGCDECSGRVAELKEVGDRLRRVVIPFPLVLAGAGAGLAASSGGAASGGAATAGLIPSGWVQSALRPLQKPLLYASVGLFALSIMAVAIVGGPRPEDGTIDSRPAPVAGSPSPATLGDDEDRFGLAISFGDPIPAGAIQLGTSSTAASDDPDGGNGGGATPQPPPPPPEEEPEPVVNLSAAVGPAGTLGVSAGVGDGSCTGATVAGASVGCAPSEQSGGRNVTLSTKGSLVGDHEIAV